MTLTVILTLTLKYLQFFKVYGNVTHVLYYTLTSCGCMSSHGHNKVKALFGKSHNPYRTMTFTFDG